MKKIKVNNLVLPGLILLLLNCNMQDIVVKNFFKKLPVYFIGKNLPSEKLDKIAKNIYTYQRGFDRSLIINSPKGWIIFDSFGSDFSKSLLIALKKVDASKRVHYLIYSHYHLDHVNGGKLLQASNVMGHEKLPIYWKDMDPRFTKNIASLTIKKSGDYKIQFGKIKIQAIFLGKSHTDNLYSFYFPKEKILYSPDMGLVRTIPPAGLPDMYYPGYIKALKKLISLDFKTWIPSHFQMGKKKDLVDFLIFFETMHELISQAFIKYGTPGSKDFTKETGSKIYKMVYPPLKAKYEKWYGFDPMILTNLIRQFAGTYLGF